MYGSKVDEILVRLKENPPPIRAKGKGISRLDFEAFRFLAKYLPDDAHVVETRIGLSTIFFSALGVRHTAVGSELDAVEGIRRYCEEQGISLARTTFVIESPTDCIWDLGEDEFDLILIDGHRGFPVPIVDWLSLNPRLRPHGIVAVDDIQTWTGAVLANFLGVNSKWETLWRMPFSRTAVYRCKEEVALRGIDCQPYAPKTTGLTAFKYRCSRAVRRIFNDDMQHGSYRLRHDRRRDYCNETGAVAWSGQSARASRRARVRTGR